MLLRAAFDVPRGTILATDRGVIAETFEWIRRARRLVPREDRDILLCPPRLVARFAGFAGRRMLGSAGHAPAADVLARDPELVTLLVDLWRVLARHYFRASFAGIEHVPAAGPMLLVGNHSGGFLPTEGFLTALAIHDRFGVERAIYALAHDFLFEDPTLRRYAGRLGILRAGHDSAHAAFAAGAGVLVYPGSDWDTFRPFRDRYRVVLAGRHGFIKLALREQVPIVPVVSAGNHEQFVVLARGERLARWTHAHEWARSEVLPVVASLPWGITSGFVPYLPLPAQTTLSFLPAMTWPGASPDDAAAVEICYRDVEAAMQHELDRLAENRHFLRGVRPPRARPTHLRETHIARDRAARDAAATPRSSSP